MTRRQWQDSNEKALGLFLNGRAITERDATGGRIIDDSFLLLFNGWHEEVTVTVPAARLGRRWQFELGTAWPETPAGAWPVPARGTVGCPGRSVTVLRRG